MDEELVKRLRNCTSDTVEDCAGCPYQGGYKGTYCMNGLITDAADAIEALEEKAMALSETLYAYEHPWIPVTERLPQDGQDVLAYLANEYETRIIPANYDHGVWYDCIFNRQADQITHWMPPPEPPNEGSQMVTDSNQVPEDEE